MFVHTSAPATFDFGASYGFSNALLLGDDELDLFVFLGEPRTSSTNTPTSLESGHASPVVVRVVDEPHHLFSEDEVRSVAAKLRRTASRPT